MDGKRKLAVSLFSRMGLQEEWEGRVFENHIKNHIHYESTIRRILSGSHITDALKVPYTRIIELEDSITQCPKCGSRKLIETSVQTRSADEAATSFFKCTKCEYKWKV